MGQCCSIINMGNNKSQEVKLSERAVELAVEVFQAIDVDESLTIDFKESAEWWGDNFSVINSRAMFEAVDLDGNGKIDMEEWLNFWAVVKKKGHSDEEIEQELTNIKERGTWCQFVSCPKIRSKAN